MAACDTSTALRAAFPGERLPDAIQNLSLREYLGRLADGSVPCDLEAMERLLLLTADQLLTARIGALSPDPCQADQLVITVENEDGTPFITWLRQHGDDADEYAHGHAANLLHTIAQAFPR